MEIDYLFSRLTFFLNDVEGFREFELEKRYDESGIFVRVFPSSVAPKKELDSDTGEEEEEEEEEEEARPSSSYDASFNNITLNDTLNDALDDTMLFGRNYVAKRELVEPHFPDDSAELKPDFEVWRSEKKLLRDGGGIRRKKKSSRAGFPDRSSYYPKRGAGRRSTKTKTTRRDPGLGAVRDPEESEATLRDVTNENDELTVGRNDELTEDRNYELTADRNDELTDGRNDELTDVRNDELTDDRNDELTDNITELTNNITELTNNRNDTYRNYATAAGGRRKARTFADAAPSRKRRRVDNKNAGKKSADVIKTKFCRKCDLPFTDERSLRRHYWRVHFKPVVCHLCGKKKKTNKDLGLHVKMEHDGDGKKPERDYKCAQCPYAGYAEDNLKSHVRRCHSAKTYRCPHCAYSCSVVAYLTRHMITHDPDAKKKIRCPRCPSTFSRKGYLAVHLRETHNTKRTFACDLCSKSFVNLHRLKRHKEGVHLGRRFTCVRCGAAFTQRTDLNRHVKNKHSDDDDVVKSLVGRSA